ncbi:hypothetical protein EDC14_102245 [Hydrogenispora ethanolica]|uniref:2-phosphosulfolactate phosphatase n=1 Tax=Hydrogenispora ethanolica TaxID=1082276 RepID=A0A4R1RB43_HYDET|nr:hypothetical protein [Hydrogenispora ethanolica]TCL62991.1 hypothetical protein EDC14_102245 [Hydrogenispora ethanolica]
MQTVHLTFNASGAVEGARRGDAVVIVDIIDMSTSTEVALESGAIAVFGAAPTGCKVPLNINPDRIGYLAGKTALKYKTQLIVVAEPRYGEDSERAKRAEAALAGVARSGAEVGSIIPNIGTEIGKFAVFTGKVVLFISDTGGVAFDAAYNNGAPAVLTATVVRTPLKKGCEPAKVGIERAIETARKLDCGITIVAASANSLEDVLAAQYLTQAVIQSGFLNPA